MTGDKCSPLTYQRYFPQWLGTCNVDDSLLKTQPSAYTQKYPPPPLDLIV